MIIIIIMIESKKVRESLYPNIQGEKIMIKKAYKCKACGAKDICKAIDGVKLCHNCYSKMQDKVIEVTNSGEGIDILKIAAEMYRENKKVGSYLLRDIPNDLWDKAKHEAVNRGVSLREMLITALSDSLKKQQHTI